MSPYIATIETRVCGIPCMVGVSSYNFAAPNQYADNDIDYYGYTELCWDVLDQRGRIAPWLERKLSEDEVDRIELEIAEFFRVENDRSIEDRYYS